MPAEVIKIVGARQHNLKNLTVEIPREKLVVITGLSGSGKSSLAFDTLYAEGQRKYVESLSAYARQFLDQMQKPEVDFIEGLSPAIAIEQRGSGGQSALDNRHDHRDLRLSAAPVLIGRPAARSRRPARPSSSSPPQQIADQIEAYPPGLEDHHPGADRPVAGGGIPRCVRAASSARASCARGSTGRSSRSGAEPIKLDKARAHSIEIVVDRLVIREGVRARLADSIDTALKWGGSRLLVLRQTPDAPDDWEELKYSTDFCNPETGIHPAATDAEAFLLQQPPGGLPGLPRPRHGIVLRLRPDDPRPAKIARRRGGRPVAADRASGCSTSTPASCGRWRRGTARRWMRRTRELPAAFKEALCFGTGDRAGRDRLGRRRRRRRAPSGPSRAGGPDAAALRRHRERTDTQPPPPIYEPPRVLRLPRRAAAAGDPRGHGPRADRARRTRTPRPRN